MKEESVKILSICSQPYEYYESNGSMYKTHIETTKIFGLGDDGKIYRWGNHMYTKDTGYKTILGWELFKPN